MTSTPEKVATQRDTSLEAGAISPEQELQIWKRRHFIARQVIQILKSENRELKTALGRRAAA